MIDRKTMGVNLMRKVEEVYRQIDGSTGNGQCHTTERIALDMNVTLNTVKRYTKLLESEGQIEFKDGGWWAISILEYNV